MNILLYLSGITKNSGGIYQYTNALLKTLATDTDNKYFLFCARNPDFDVHVSDKTSLAYINDLEPTLVQSRVSLMKKSLRRLSKRLGFRLNFKVLNHFDYIREKYHIDVLYSPYQFLPNTSIPSVVTLHDVQELHYPEFFTSEKRAFRAVRHKKSIDMADAVVVSYQHVKDDIVRFFEKPVDQVYVVLLSMQNLWFERLQSSNFKLKTKLELPETFVLYPAATWPHKNHFGILNAIKLLKNKGLTVNLICTGHQDKNFTALQNRLSELDLKEQVTFLGVVDDETLYHLYKTCLGVVVPTLYEAGSFPLMEAMLMEVPVVCSSVTSLPETIGNEEFTFDPHNIGQMADKIERLVLSIQFRQQNIENSRREAPKLLNTNALEKIKQIFKDVVEHKTRSI